MKIEQYKNDVSSLKLSDSFKQSLKESMAKEYASVAVNETPARPWIKYSKYIATAACLVLIVATISVASLVGGSLRVEKSLDDVMANDMPTAETFDSANGDDATKTAVTDEETDVDEDIVVEEDAVDDEVPAEEDETLEDVTDEVEAATDEEDVIEEAVEPDIDAVTEEAPAEPYKSAYAPEDYDGEYYAEDYIVGNATSPDFEALNVAVSVGTLYAFDGEIDDAPVAEEAPVEEEVSEITTDDYEGMSYSELCLNVLPDLDSVNFVRFSITDVYSADEAYEITNDSDFLNCKTLYEININYDYLNGAELDLTMNLAAYGTSENQLAGKPVFEDGDRILGCLTFDNNGYAELLEELTYVIHRINGLDVAYHLTGGEGVDPGYTNMGMLDIEYEVITSTVNNPALYTHKAAVKELTRYIKRNWARQEFEFTDFDNLEENPQGDDEVSEETTSPSVESVRELSVEKAQGEVKVSLEGVEFDPKGAVSTELQNRLSNKTYSSVAMQNGSRVEFDGTVIMFDSVTVFRGQITEIATSSNKPVKILVNGVGVGDSLEKLVKAFDIKENVDQRLSLEVLTVSENGTDYVVTIEVVDNVITQMIIK